MSLLCLCDKPIMCSETLIVFSCCVCVLLSLVLLFQNKLGDNGVLLLPSAPHPAPYHFTSLLRPYNFAYWGIVNVLKCPATQVKKTYFRWITLDLQENWQKNHPYKKLDDLQLSIKKPIPTSKVPVTSGLQAFMADGSHYTLSGPPAHCSF